MRPYMTGPANTAHGATAEPGRWAPLPFGSTFDRHPGEYTPSRYAYVAATALLLVLDSFCVVDLVVDDDLRETSLSIHRSPLSTSERMASIASAFSEWISYFWASARHFSISASSLKHKVSYLASAASRS